MLKKQLERISTAMISHTPEALKRSYFNLKNHASTEEENVEQYFPAREAMTNTTVASVEWTSNGSCTNSLRGDNSNCPSFRKHSAFVNQIE